MANITTQPTVEASATIRFTEIELRALDALCGYGIDPFLKVFYEKMGEGYMKPHEAGLRSIFAEIRRVVPKIIDRADMARKAFEE